MTASDIEALSEARSPSHAGSGWTRFDGRGALAPLSPLQMVVRLTKPVEPDARCDVSFEVLPGFAYFSHDQLNRQTDNLNWDLFYCDALRDFYTVLGIERFDHAGVRGA
jgi:hypothetical protein